MTWVHRIPETLRHVEQPEEQVPAPRVPNAPGFSVDQLEELRLLQLEADGETLAAAIREAERDQEDEDEEAGDPWDAEEDA